MKKHLLQTFISVYIKSMPLKEFVKVLPFSTSWIQIRISYY